MQRKATSVITIFVFIVLTLFAQVVAASEIDLFKAAADGDMDKVRTLLEQGEDVNARGKDGLSALFIASHTGKSDIVRLLIDNGANVNIKTVDGATPLIAAATQGHENVVKVLLSEGADVEAEAHYKGKTFTALRMAHDMGHRKIETMLVLKLTEAGSARNRNQ